MTNSVLKNQCNIHLVGAFTQNSSGSGVSVNFIHVDEEKKQGQQQPTTKEKVLRFRINFPWKRLHCFDGERDERVARRRAEAKAFVFRTCKEIGPLNYDIYELSGRMVGPYHFKHYLGRGAFGKVYSTSDINDNPLAVKVLVKSKFRRSPAHIDTINMEIGLLRRHGHHPNLLSLHDVLHAPKNIYVVMERGTMDLKTLQKQTNAFTMQSDLLQQLAQGMLEALNYLHSKGVAHLDIKPDNILVSTTALRKGKLLPGHRIESSSVRLADLGLAVTSDNYDETDTQDESDFHHQLDPKHDIVFQGRVGTPGYGVPQMVDGYCTYEARMADLWAVGMTLLKLCPQEYGVGFLIQNLISYQWQPDKYYSILSKYLDRQKKRRNFKNKEEQLFHDLVFGKRGVLVVEERNRSNCWEALQHPWFQYEMDSSESDEVRLARSVECWNLSCLRLPVHIRV